MFRNAVVAFLLCAGVRSQSNKDLYNGQFMNDLYNNNYRPEERQYEGANVMRVPAPGDHDYRTYVYNNRRYGVDPTRYNPYNPNINKPGGFPYNPIPYNPLNPSPLDDQYKYNINRDPNNPDALFPGVLGGWREDLQGKERRDSRQLKRDIFVNTNYGQVQGFKVYLYDNPDPDSGYRPWLTPVERIQGEASVFLGIPYARPPVLEGRFKPPRQHPGWQLMQAVDWGPACPQPVKYTGATKGIRDMDEDCLYLNIFSPNTEAGATAQKYPVMVYIHGGQFQSGASNLFPAHMLAAFYNVVVVSINYRLGALGFLSTADENSPGNYGILDQALALRWIYDNIGPFNGDKDSITLFGPGAGAASAGLLAVAPQTRHIVTKIIAQALALRWTYDNIGPFNGDKDSITLFGPGAGAASAGLLAVAPQTRHIVTKIIAQALALRWIYDNIGPFNGDKDSITLFGPGAGAASAGLLAVAPQTRHIVTKIIAQALALRWTYDNIGPFNGDKDSITLFGPGAGAASAGLLAVAPQTRHIVTKIIAQALALRWTYDNIGPFNGDKDSITLFGPGAGAASAGLLAVAPQTRHIVTKIIAQALALRWTYDNIGPFNGDKDSITLFGPGAGAAAAGLLAVAPQTRHIVTKIIAQSVPKYATSSQTYESSPGNYGILDQALALRWIYDNIGPFNGDKDSITLFGPGAGAASAGLLAVAPQTRHIVTKIIAQALALRWIYDNIGPFNGDKDSITLFGPGAGAASAGLLAVAPQTRHIVTKIIAQALALRWIYDNIGPFNGDKDSITLFGPAWRRRRICWPIGCGATDQAYSHQNNSSGKMISPFT
ncbi:carboxylesterase family domain-containing protein [Phthorimaea operculella]|nr:carboxylesterase family domain-containing protein [Phthorimaea operculella]